ncbi:YfhO family protein [bacterium]|nr:YfhO family protein [bacterium]
MEGIIDIKEKKTFKEKIKSFFENVFSSNKKALTFLASMLLIIMAIYFLVILIFRNNFYNNWSDDSLQYYPFMCDFIDNIKSGNFSWYSFKNYLGSSIFSDTYYIPLDGFTLAIFILSFLMNTEIAMSIIEIVKLIAGAVAIGAYLAVKGYKPKTSFLIGLLYFSSSGITCFSCFPSFTSLAFYLPFSLIIGHYFLKGKWYFVPLYSMLLVFYNYYLAYTVFAFMAFSLLFMLLMEKRNIFKSVLKLITYVLLIVLGLLMAFVVFFPSIEFVLQSTSREVAGGGSLKSLFIMFETYIDVFITFIVCSAKAVFRLFTTPKGFMHSYSIIQDSFVQLRYLYKSVSVRRYVGDILVLPSFFNVEEYYRVMTTTFTPLYPSSFYGYQSSYLIEHISLYVTGIGLVLSTYIWSMKDRRSNVYKAVILLSIFMMWLPFFSYILSGSLDVLYTRWFNVVTIPILLASAYAVNENGLYNLNEKPTIIGLLVLLFFGIFGAYHHLAKTRAIAISSSINPEVIKFINNLFYLTILALFILFLSCIVLNIKAKKKEEKHKKLKTILIIISTILIIALIATMLLIDYGKVSNEIWSKNFGSDADLFDINVQVGQQYLSILILAIMIINTFAILNNKKVVFGIVLGIEVVLSGCFSFGASVINEGKETTFVNSYKLSNFLEQNIDEPAIYKIYVDSSIPNILRTNTSSLIPTGANSDIFHSFIYAGTDEVVELIFDIKNEGQASKKALNTYSYYLNVFLGYKYVVATNESSFANYDENIFDLVTKNDDYILLKFKDYQEFLVYDEYTSFDNFKKVTKSLNEVSKEKELTNVAVVDDELLDKLQGYNLTNKIGEAVEEISTTTIYKQQQSISAYNKEIVNINDKLYYKYNFTDDDEITSRSYAINIFSFSNRVEELTENNNMFLEFENLEQRYITREHVGSKNGSTFHIPVYGSDNKYELKPKSLYVLAEEGTTTLSPVPTLSYTVEGIFPSIKEVNNYENGREIPANDGLSAALRFRVDKEYDNKIISVVLRDSGTKSLPFDTVLFEYDDGSIESASSEMTIDRRLVNIYIIKTNEIYNLATPPTIKLLSYSLNETYQDSYQNKKISTKRSKINISYTKEQEEGYDMIMIPTAYSSEWKVVSGEVEDIIKVNGGFIGLVVPKNIQSNDITLQFIPNGLKLGAIVSIASIIFYLGIVSISLLIKKKGGKENAKLESNNSSLQ